MKNQRLATIYGLSAVLLWSTVASAFKLSLEHLRPVELLLWSGIVSTGALLVVVAARGELGSIFKGTSRQLGRSAALGFLNPFLYYLVLFEAYDRLPAQEAQPLNYTWAITLTLLSIPLLGQRVRRLEIVALFVSYAGVLVISTRGDLTGLQFEDPVGVALALGSTIIWALYWIGNTGDDRDPVVGLLLNFLFGVPLVAVWAWWKGAISLPSTPGLVGATYVGMFEMGFTFVLWLLALKRSENTARVANLIFLSPFLSLIFIRFVVGEEIRPSTIVGLVLIVAGLLVQQRARRPA